MSGMLPLVFIIVLPFIVVLGLSDNSGVISNSNVINALVGQSTLLAHSNDAAKVSNEDNLPGNKRIIRLCENNPTFLAENPTWTVPDFARVPTPGEAESFNFSLEFGRPFCEDAAYDLVIKSNTSSADAKLAMGKFRDNGYLQIGNDFYNTDEYCLSRWLDNEVEVKICKPECSNSRPCVRKCLPPGTVLSYSTRKAAKTEIEYMPKFYKDLPEKLTPVDSATIRPHYVRHKPKKELYNCTGAIMTNPFSENIAKAISAAENTTLIASIKFRVRTDGRLFFDDLDDYNCLVFKELKIETVCIDGIKDAGVEKPFGNMEDEGVMFSCDLPSDNNAVFSLAFGIIMLLSSSFLFLILIVYGLLWKQQNIHGWTVIGHTTSMFFAYIFVGLSHIIGAKYYSIIGSTYCYVHGVLTHFFFLSTFCWLTLISFDLWWTFRSVTPSKKKVDNRLYVHMGIGWGIPALIVIISVCLDLGIGNNCTSIRLPKYGQKSCFVTPHSLGHYIYYPVAITLTLDVIFFCVTLYWLYHYKKNTQSVSKKSQDNRRQLLTLFSKLFFVMGVTWVFEFISWVHAGVQVKWFWAVVDTINVLQAFAIFVVYVCKKDIMDNLEKTYPFLSKHLLKYIRSGCCKKRQDAAEDDKEKTRGTLLACSNH